MSDTGVMQSIARLVPERSRVLDLGCGSGRDVYLLSALVGERGEVVGVDMTPEKSLYDLAARVFAAHQVMLREHFRCVQPIIAYLLMVYVFHVDHEVLRYGVLLAAMPSGINAYVFATYYNRGVNVATNTVLISTVLSVLTVSAWLFILGL